MEKLEEEVDKLNQEEIDKKKQDQEEREAAQAAHAKFKDDMAQNLFIVKENLDTVLSNPNMIC